MVLQDIVPSVHTARGYYLRFNLIHDLHCVCHLCIFPNMNKLKLLLIDNAAILSTQIPSFIDTAWQTCFAFLTCLAHSAAGPACNECCTCRFNNNIVPSDIFKFLAPLRPLCPIYFYSLQQLKINPARILPTYM